MAKLSRLQWAGLVSGLVLVVGYTLLLSWAMQVQSYASWGALIVVPVVLLIDLGLLWFAARLERDRLVTWLMVAGLLLKCVGAFVRYVTVYFLYDGAADAVRYTNFAAEHYTMWRDGVVGWESSLGQGGTQNLELITTFLFVAIGPSPLAAFLVFGSMAYWGAYFLYRAFRLALPSGSPRRYSALVFLMPSLLFWPSSIGKEAWLLCFVGLFAYGVARLFAGHWLGLAWMAGGIVGIVLIRPHIAVLLVASVAVALIVKRTDRSPKAFLTKVASIAITLIALVYLISSAAEFLGLSDVTADSVSARVGIAGENTDQGGSAFTPVPLGSPLGLPAAVVTILFRPFVWESSHPLMVLQGVEGLLLLVLAVRAWPRIRGLPGLLRDNSYVTFCVVYCLGFIVAFSGFANFGILARQRVLMWPFFFVLLALPHVVRGAEASSEIERARPLVRK